MKPLELVDIPQVEVFAAQREAWRTRIIAHKAERRVPVGDRVSLLFEDRETLRWQVLEMCRVEGTRSPAGVQHELDVYNALMPGAGELSATLSIEITNLAEIRPELDRLIGIDEHVLLRVGAEEIRARFDEKQFEEDRISALQYIRFALDEKQALALAEPETPAALVIDHPAYTHEAALSQEVRSQLLTDLAGGCAPLVRWEPQQGIASEQDQVLAEGAGWRLLKPAVPRAEQHHVVEAAAGVSFSEAGPEHLGELLAAARETADALLKRYGRCRISLDVGACPLRINVFVPARS